jgi:hypothetical protein
MKYLLLVCLFLVSSYAKSLVSTSYAGTSDYKLLKNSISNTNYALKTTNGDIENLKDVLKDTGVKLAVVQEDILYDLIKQNPALKSKLEIVTPLYHAVVVLIAPKDSSISSFKDISNRSIAVDVEGSGDYYTLLREQEVDLVEPETYNMKKSSSFEYLNSGKVSAVFYVGNLKDIKDIKRYKIISINGDYKKRTFRVDDNRTMALSVVDKFLVSTKDKVAQMQKREINELINNVVKSSKYRDICRYNLDNTPVYALKSLYVVCSQQNFKIDKKVATKTTPKREYRKPPSVKKNQITKIKTPKAVVENRAIKKRVVRKTEQYFDNLEDIVIYPQALRDRSFANDITTNSIEELKFKNALSLMKKELKNDSKTRIVIDSEGNGAVSVKNVDYIYRRLKKAGIPRGSMIKKAINTGCVKECFKKTTVHFELL